MSKLRLGEVPLLSLDHLTGKTAEPGYEPRQTTEHSSCWGGNKFGGGACALGWAADSIHFEAPATDKALGGSPGVPAFCSDKAQGTHTYLCPRAELLQSCLTLCNPMDCSPPGSSVHGVLQARVLDLVAMSSSRGSSWPRDQTRVSNFSCLGRQVLYH